MLCPPPPHPPAAGQAADFDANRPQFGKPFVEFGLIQEKFARMAVDAYAGEAMAYMTTALIDGPGLDMSLEAAICKIYGSEAMFRGINDCIQILGGVGFAAGGTYPFERLMRDSRILLIFEGTNEILRLLVGLTGLQAAGGELKGLQAKLANPLAALPELPALAGRYLRTTYGIGTTPVPCDAPALAGEAAAVGAAVAAFQGSIQTVLMKHGKDIVEKQLTVQRIANSAIDLYGCLAVLSRASASVKRGAPHIEHEMLLAKSFLSGALGRLATNAREIKAGEARNGDVTNTAIATQILKAGHYLAEHPLRLSGV